MPISYEEYTNISGEKYLLKTDENKVQSWVPCDSSNADYQRYLNPEAEQSTPSVTNGD